MFPRHDSEKYYVHQLIIKFLALTIYQAEFPLGSHSAKV